MYIIYGAYGTSILFYVISVRSLRELNLTVKTGVRNI